MLPMPVFEFACENCDQEFEELVLRRNEVIQCPACGSQKAKKLMSRFATTGESRLRLRQVRGLREPLTPGG
jgi:putative FmdB family regulatory protein